MNFPSGGLSLLAARLIEAVGHTSRHVAQAKQSGIVLSCLRMAPITSEGQALLQASQPMHVA